MQKKYVYNDYVKNITARYGALLDDVNANYNFDLGIEYELVICEVLKRVLPKKFGVCRGFLVAKDGSKEGDDIIIFDRYRFPQIRLLDENDLGHKQEIPVEAAYAYIEAKNSLNPESIRKAMSQVSKIKKIVSKREKVDLKMAFNPYFPANISDNIQLNPNWPDKLKSKGSGLTFHIPV